MTTNTQTESKTQAAMVSAYISQHGLDTMYTRTQWYRWNGKVWEPKHEFLISRELKDFLRAGYTSATLSQVQRLVQVDLFQTDDTMDSDDEMINLNNGIYHLAKNVLYPHHPDHHLTTILPFDFNPKAICPAWNKYLKSTFVLDDGTPDTEMAALLQEAIGYSLTTSVKHHLMFWCYGDGSNGKGTLFHVIKKLLGSGGMELDVDGFHHNHYQLALLAGKRVATSAEVKNADKLADDPVIKRLAAGDEMQVRMIKEAPFQMQPTAKLWWSMNDLPPIDETSEGVWRRIRIIPFTRKFTDADKNPDLKDALDTELAGIFNWALAGLKRVNANNAICIPSRAAAVKADYQHESNRVQLFVEEMCNLTQGEYISQPVLYASFKRWLIDNTYKLMSSSRMRKEMEKLRIYTHKRNGVVVFDHITLKAEGIDL